MELQIQDLVESIKRDGILEAEKRAAEIIADAKTKADEIVRTGAKDAAKLIEDARKEVAVMQQSGRAAVEQASRDVLLSLKKAIQAQFDILLEKELEKTFSGEQLVSLIVQVVQSGLTDPATSSVELNKEQVKALATVLKTKLAQEMKSGLEIRPVEGVRTGFKLSQKDGKSFYDFSTGEIATLMAPFLNPLVQEIVFGSAQKR